MRAVAGCGASATRGDLLPPGSGGPLHAARREHPQHLGDRAAGRRRPPVPGAELQDHGRVLTGEDRFPVGRGTGRLGRRAEQGGLHAMVGGEQQHMLCRLARPQPACPVADAGRDARQHLQRIRLAEFAQRGALQRRRLLQGQEHAPRRVPGERPAADGADRGIQVTFGRPGPVGPGEPYRGEQQRVASDWEAAAPPAQSRPGRWPGGG